MKPNEELAFLHPCNRRLQKYSGGQTVTRAARDAGVVVEPSGANCVLTQTERGSVSNTGYEAIAKAVSVGADAVEKLVNYICRLFGRTSGGVMCSGKWHGRLLGARRLGSTTVEILLSDKVMRQVRAIPISMKRKSATARYGSHPHRSVGLRLYH